MNPDRTVTTYKCERRMNEKRINGDLLYAFLSVSRLNSPMNLEVSAFMKITDIPILFIRIYLSIFNNVMFLQTKMYMIYNAVFQ